MGVDYGTVSKSSGDDGMLTSIKTVPTYYIILEVAGLPQKTRDSLSYYASSQERVAIMHPIAGIEREDEEILISLDLELIDALKKGSKIEIKGYTMQGDEWGCSSVWSSMKLDGKPVPKRNRQDEQDGVRKPATAPAPKSEGKEKPKPESEGRSQ